MRNTFLATASIIALIGFMGAIPSLAENGDVQTPLDTKAEASTSGNIAKDAKIALKDMKSDTAEAYEDIKAMLMGKEKADKNIPVTINSRTTAKGMIGQHVYNEKNESVAKVTDIIVGKDGKAMMIVVSESLLGMGAKAAFDYSAITRVEDDGDVIMSVTNQIIDNAASFSYDKSERGEKMRVIPDNGYSVAKLLDGKLVNQKKEPVADIENIAFKSGTANQIIVGFDKTLGMGGEKAVFDFSDAKIIRDDKTVDFQLSTEKAAQFETYKQALSN